LYQKKNKHSNTRYITEQPVYLDSTTTSNPVVKYPHSFKV